MTARIVSQVFAVSPGSTARSHPGGFTARSPRGSPEGALAWVEPAGTGRVAPVGGGEGVGGPGEGLGGAVAQDLACDVGAVFGRVDLTGAFQNTCRSFGRTREGVGRRFGRRSSP